MGCDLEGVVSRAKMERLVLAVGVPRTQYLWREDGEQGSVALLVMVVLVLVLVLVLILIVVFTVVLGYRGWLATGRVRLLSMMAAAVPVDCGEQGRGLGWPT